jgi:Mrp family chromosome partitioning ATPase/capsular polysaccharide biosynthesis protein
VLVPALAYLFSMQQTPQYVASAEILLNRQDLVASATDISAPGFIDPERLAATQSALAESPILAQRVVAAANVPGLTVSGFLSSSEVSPRSDADVLEFIVRGSDPETVKRLVNVSARQYILLRRDIETRALNDAMRNVQAEINRLERQGVSSGSPLYAQLLDVETNLETLATLQTANSVFIKPAQGAAKFSPNPRRDALLGAIFGAVIGLAFAFGLEALDRRVRSEREVEELLGIPLLGKLPKPRLQLRRAGEIAMLADPESSAAEAIRQLRTNVGFTIASAGARTILVTSAMDGEGKSTTAANLAVAFARAGRRVILVDLDLRHAGLHRFFKTPPVPGIAEVISGGAGLDDVLTPIIVSEGPSNGPVEASNGKATTRGSLQLLAAGTPPRDPGEFVAETALADVLTELRGRAEVVLIDAPPMLSVSDAAVLSAFVDAMLVVTQLRVTRRPALVSLRHQLGKCPAVQLGFVATGATPLDVYGYDSEGYEPDEAVVTGRVSVASRASVHESRRPRRQDS